MSRVIRRPATDPVRLDIFTREPSGVVPWTEFVRALTSSDPFRTRINVFDGFALREKLENVAPGETTEIPEDVWGIFRELLLKPAIFTASVCQSPECLAMFRDITEAPVAETPKK